MRAVSLASVLLCAARVVSAQTASGEPPAPKVVRVEVTGNQLLQPETLLFYVSVKAGDDLRREAGCAQDFRKLWDTGFLDDLRVESYDAPAGGKLVALRDQRSERIQIVDSAAPSS